MPLSKLKTVYQMIFMFSIWKWMRYKIKKVAWFKKGYRVLELIGLLYLRHRVVLHHHVEQKIKRWMNLTRILILMSVWQKENLMLKWKNSVIQWMFSLILPTMQINSSNEDSISNKHSRSKNKENGNNQGTKSKALEGILI